MSSNPSLLTWTTTRGRTTGTRRWAAWSRRYGAGACRRLIVRPRPPAPSERVRRTAVGILDQLETPQVGDGDPPGLDRTTLATKREAAKAEAPARTEPAAVVGL